MEQVKALSTLRNTIAAAMVMGGLIAGAAAPTTALADNDYGYAPTGGAKKSVAVAKFDGNGAFLANYGGWDVGGGLAAILVSELTETGQFRVVNRANLDAALYEQTLTHQGLTAARTVQAGQLVGAQYLIRGSVTEFSATQSGSGISLGGNLGDFVGGVSPQMRKGHIGLDISVFDAQTGEIVKTVTVREKIRRAAIAGNISNGDFSVGGNKFHNSVIGKVARKAIAQAVQEIAYALSGRAWTANVAQVRADMLYVNAGQDSGLRVGDRLKIYRVMEKIVDPVTGAVLGLEETMVGTATISSVQPQFAKANYQASAQPQIGDILRLEGSGNVASR